MFKRWISMLLILVLLSGTMVYAEGDTGSTDETQESGFSDVFPEDWYYDAVMTMSEYGIIEGYPDGTFRPKEPVLREQYAVMMVKALKLEIKESSPTFIDVAEGYWAFPYIETAKPYLTGWNRNGDLVFKPKEHAVREDMAVALVYALGKPADVSMLSTLNEFEDTDKISDNLIMYMASAIHHNLMSGSLDNGVKYLKPQETLTRGQAAALLMSVIEEEKIVFGEEEKIVINDGAFELTGSTVEGGVKLNWSYNSDQSVSGYKVVASQVETAPMYPENGYATYTQDNHYTIYNNSSYNGEEFSKFVPGETYNISITALVGEEKIVSNTIQITMPAAVSVEGKQPLLTAVETSNGFNLTWSEIDTNGLQGYKVVASKTDTTPVYPDNGYSKWITDLDTRSYGIEPGTYYSGGDLGGSFKSGETYYVAITAVYDSGKFSSNVLTLTMPGEISEPVPISQRTPTVNVVVKDGFLEVTWSEISTEGLNGYKITASKSDETPVYPENGYAYWITNLSTHKKEIYPYAAYNNGDFSKFVPGETYHISVTAVYSDQKIPGNTVTVTMPE